MDSQDLISRFNHILEAVDAQIEEVKAGEVQKGILEAHERELAEKSHTLDEREKFLAKKDIELKGREDYIVSQNVRLRAWDAKLTEKAESLKGLAQEKEDIDHKKVDLDTREAVIEEKLQKAEEVKTMLATVQSEKQLARKRTEILDLRAKRISQREQQLQIESEVV